MNNQTTNYGLFIIAFISAIMTFAGLLHLVSDGDWWLKSLAALTSLAVWILLYLFWSHVFSIVPDLKLPGKRIGSWATVIVGCLFILTFSTYWNLVAYTAAETNRLSQQGIAQQATSVLARAIKANGIYISLKPQLGAFKPQIEALADGEEKSGTITGSPGKGGVGATLRQLASYVGLAAEAVDKASVKIAALKSKGQACLVDLRKAVSNGNNNAVSSQVDCLNTVVADLGNQNVAALIERSMQGLTAGIVLPVSIRTKSQKQAVQNVLSGIQKQADNIAASAASIKAEHIEPLIVEQPNAVLGVLVYWKSIIPGIGTAASIDLFPLLLLILKVIYYHDAEEMGEPRHPLTVNELLDALAQLKKLENRQDEPKNSQELPPFLKELTYQPDNEDDWYEVHELEDEDERS